MPGTRWSVRWTAPSELVLEGMIWLPRAHWQVEVKAQQSPRAAGLHSISERGLLASLEADAW
jgi:hypothetical protein